MKKSAKLNFVSDEDKMIFLSALTPNDSLFFKVMVLMNINSNSSRSVFQLRPCLYKSSYPFDNLLISHGTKDQEDNWKR